MVKPSDSDGYSSKTSTNDQAPGWLKVGIVAAASALAGGLAAAWWYRKTLKTLRQTEEIAINPHFSSETDEGSQGSVMARIGQAGRDRDSLMG
jgi:hypothetical protein